jgi:hypothetical protein
LLSFLPLAAGIGSMLIPCSYARLEDPEVVVRKNSLMVLSHLLLNDMVKLTK